MKDGVTSYNALATKHLVDAPEQSTSCRSRGRRIKSGASEVQREGARTFAADAVF
jgi:hypothetical protein